MKKIHIALGTHDADTSVADYSQRLGCEPDVVVSGTYALWRTETVNFSVRLDRSVAAGTLRHLGWEDPKAAEFSVDTDCNGISWERFTAEQQIEEIEAAWPAGN